MIRYLVRCEDSETIIPGRIAITTPAPGERFEVLPDAEYDARFGRHMPYGVVRESTARRLDGNGYYLFDERDVVELENMIDLPHLEDARLDEEDRAEVEIAENERNSRCA